MLKIRTDLLAAKFQPLDRITVECDTAGTITVHDGQGRAYYTRKAGKAVSFRAAGALGRHVVELSDAGGKVVETVDFTVDCKTGIADAGGKFARLLDMLYWTMVHWSEASTFRYEDKVYHFFVRWLRDHVHTLKGMKYFYPNLKDGIDLYQDSQEPDGMIWDNATPREPDHSHWDWRFRYGGFFKSCDGGLGEFKRIPVENDVEYLYIEGIYHTWKALGDDDWMAAKLDSAIKAYKYSTSSPYRWSKKYRLLKRGYTIDTWDFQSAEDVARSGDAMVVRLGKSEFGVMHGDNTGFAVGCDYLAEMLAHVGRDTEASTVRKLGADIRKRLDQLSWNGRFYTHHVPENARLKRDLGVDESTQVSLSNSYALNRGLTHRQCVAIIKTYQRIRREMPKSSPGEFYQIYPPFGKGFGGHGTQWEYMNGGVTTIVAGELAHGAFEHGFEDYGADILRRVSKWGEKHGGYLDCCYRGAMPDPPKRKFTTVSLNDAANIDIRGKGAKGVPGWTGEGVNDLANIPTGRRTFCDIPFAITNPKTTGRRACVGLSTKPGGYAVEVALPIGRKASSVYLLHTMAGQGLAGTAVFRYADGTEHIEYIYSDKHLGGWWSPKDPSKGRKSAPIAKVAWAGPNKVYDRVGVYACGLDNPHPGRKIDEVVLTAARNENFWAVLGVTLCDKPVFFMPSDVSFGIPDNWGAAAVVSALIEGLAGIKDTGVAYDRALIAPRWSAAGVNRASATAKYEASGGYVRYAAALDAGKKRMTLEFTGSADRFDIEVLLPKGKKTKAVTLDRKDTRFKTRKVEASTYACVTVKGLGAHKLVVTLA